MSLKIESVVVQLDSNKNQRLISFGLKNVLKKKIKFKLETGFCCFNVSSKHFQMS